MTFEEFFKKKKINLTTLQQAEGGLFSEFKAHYEVMGEKSFDHTKKYWFNKLRRLYPPPPEVKAEKVIIENPLAEQTINETLTSPIADKTKTGFTPRFKAGVNAATSPEKEKLQQTEPAEPKDTEPIKPKVGFSPRFKAGVTAKPQEPEANSQTEPAEPEDTEAPVEPVKPKVGFTTRFKAGVTAIKPPDEEANPQTEAVEPKKIRAPAEPVKPKVGFTPRFKAGVTAVKPPDEEANPQTEAVEPKNTEASAEPVKPKVGFTPRFKAGVTKSSAASEIPPASSEANLEKVADVTVPETPAANTEQTIPPPDVKELETPVAKPAYKPKFRPPAK